MWNSIDFNACSPNFAAGSHSTNENGDALNISGRGKVESQQQVFHFVYASITGDFVMTARLDGVDFAGFASNQGRTGLLLTPDITPRGNALIYGSSDAHGVATDAVRAQRPHRGGQRQCEQHDRGHAAPVRAT